MTWQQIYKYLTDLQAWLSSQPAGSIVSTTLSPHEQFLDWYYNWLSQQSFENKQAWLNYLARLRSLASSRRCRGVEMLGQCMAPGPLPRV